MKMEDQIPAFPCQPNANHTGMTLRDWFAGLVIQGLLSDHQESVNLTKMGVQNGIDPGLLTANAAYRIADFMIEARDNPLPQFKGITGV